MIIEQTFNLLFQRHKITPHLPHNLSDEYVNGTDVNRTYPCLI